MGPLGYLRVVAELREVLAEALELLREAREGGHPLPVQLRACPRTQGGQTSSVPESAGKNKKEAEGGVTRTGCRFAEVRMSEAACLRTDTVLRTTPVIAHSTCADDSGAERNHPEHGSDMRERTLCCGWRTGYRL